MVYKVNASESDPTSQTVTLSDGSTLSIDKSDFDQNKYGNTIATLTFKGSASGGVKPGDKYEFTMPSRFAHFTSSDVTHLDPSVGTTTDPTGSSNSSSTEYYTGNTTVTDTIASTFNNTFTQTFGVDISSVYSFLQYACDPDSVYPGEKFTFPITISKNGKEIKTIECTYTLPDKLSGSVAVSLANNFLPKDNKSGKKCVYNKRSYKYALTIEDYSLNDPYTSQYASAWNNGIKISFSVPKYFKLDKTIQPSVVDTGGKVKDSSGITVSQEGIGKDVYITIPAKDKVLDNSDIEVCFNGIVEAPDSFLLGPNTEVSFNNVTLTQTFPNDTVQTLKGIATPFIMKPLPKDIYDGEIFSVQKQQSGCQIGSAYDGTNMNLNIAQGLAPIGTGSFDITNVSQDVQHDIHVHIDNPDGLGIQWYTIRAYGQTTPISYTATYKLANGDTLDFSSKKDGFNGENQTSFLNALSNNLDEYCRVKSIDLTISELESMATLEVGPSSFKIFTKDAEGKSLKPGQNLRSILNINGGANHHEQVAVLFAPEVLPNSMSATLKVMQGRSDSKAPGGTSGVIRIDLINNQDITQNTRLMLENPVFYIRMPKNVSIVDESAFINSLTYQLANDDLLSQPIHVTADRVSFFNIGNDNFAEIDLRGKSIKEFQLYNSYNEGLQNVLDAQTTDNDPVELYVTSDNINSVTSVTTKSVSELDAPVRTIGEKLANYAGLNANELKGVINYGNWQILTTSATSAVEQAKGNQEQGLVLAGKSEDHADNAMTYATSIVNSTKTPLTNVQSFTNLPNTNDGKSGFGVTLTGPAKLVDPATGGTLNGAEIKYSTQAVTISKDNKPSQSSFVDGSQISDWSAVRSVLVTIPTLAAHTTARLVLPGEDQHIYDHVGKTAYLSSSTWADTQQPLIIAAGDNNSSNITVTEQDKINVEIHYKDKNGKDVYVELPDKAKIYNYGDTMKKSDFLQSDADLSDDDKAKLPAGLNIDYTNPTIQNSSDTYENGYENGTASFGGKVKYDFNNDTVVYEAVPQQDQKAQLTIIDKTTGQQINSYDATGKTDAAITFNGAADQVANYLNNHYKIDSVEHDGNTDTNVNNYSDIKFGNYDNDAKTTQSWIIYLVHQYAPVKPGNPSEPDDPSNKYKDINLVKNVTRDIQYVISNNDTGATVPAEKKETKTFVANGYEDLVTGNLCNVKDGKVADQNGTLTWTVLNGNSDEASFNDVTNPTVTGYHVTSITPQNYAEANNAGVKGSTVTHTSPDQLIVVVYAKDKAPEAEKAILHIIDQTDGNKELTTLPASGKDGADISFNGADTILNALTNYKIVGVTDDPSQPTKDGTNYDAAAGQWKFDTDPTVDQNFYVYLTHAYAPINPQNPYGRTDLTRTVTETVHYVNEATGKPIAPDGTQTLTFTGSGTIDKVTGKLLKTNSDGTPDTKVADEIDISTAKDSDFTWTAPQTLKKVTSPTVDGYTVDAAKTTPSDLADGNDIKAIDNVAYNHGNVEATVYYNVNQEKLTYTVVDDTFSGGKILVDHQDLASGKTNTALPLGVVGQYAGIRNDWLAKGYKLDPAKANGLGYDILPDSFGTGTQNVTIYLIHGQKMAPAKDTADVTETIHYVYANGDKQNQPAAKDYQKTYHFTATQLVDAVTGDPILKDNQPQLTWSPDQHTDAVQSPAAYDRDYTPEQTVVLGQLISHDSKPIEITVPYYIGDQNVYVHYIDVNGVKAGENGYQPTDGNELTSHLQSLKGTAGEEYTNTLWDYTNAGYKFAQEDKGATAGNFDSDSKTDQNYYVYLTHATEPVQSTKTVKETIHYVYQNGPRAGQEAHTPFTQNVTFKGSQDRDLVTHQLIGTPTWTPTSTTFKDVDSPAITGYKPDQAKAGATTVTPTSQDTDITVYYNADQQALTYTVKDDTTGKTMEDHQGLATGDTNSQIPNSVASKYDQIRSGWLAKGYKLDTTQANGLGYDILPDNFGTGTQNVTIYLVHGQKTVPVKDTTDGNATQTITYIYGNGPKKGQTAAPTKTTTYHFTATEVVDAVTGEPIKDAQGNFEYTWSPAQLTDTITTPAAEDTNYTPDQTSIPAERINHGDKLTHVVHYYIGDQNVYVHYIDVNGVKAGENGYQPTDGNELTNHLQSLKGDAGDQYNNTLWNYTDAGYKLAQADKGATTGNFDSDSKTDQNYYVYLTHDLDTVTTTKQVGETINYLYKGTNQTIAPVYHAKGITFTGTQSKDKVTGDLVGNIKWTPTDGNFSKGYWLHA